MELFTVPECVRRISVHENHKGGAGAKPPPLRNFCEFESQNVQLRAFLIQTLSLIKPIVVTKTP